MSQQNPSSIFAHAELLEWQRKALAEHPLPKDQRLPAYGEVPSRHGPVELLEKDTASVSTKSSSSTISSLKSMFRSEDKSRTPSNASSKSASSTKSSTLKSILTGDVHKHNPRFRMEDNLDRSLYSRK